MPPTSPSATDEIELDSEGHFIVGLVDIFRKGNTMSTMEDTKARRTRRSFTEDYKTGAVRLVLDEGKTVAAAVTSR